MAKTYTPAGKELDETDKGASYSIRYEDRRIAGTKNTETKILCYVEAHTVDGAPVPNTEGKWADQVLSPTEQSQLASILAKFFSATTTGDEFKTA
jgi:hypothetical protein